MHSPLPALLRCATLVGVFAAAGVAQGASLQLGCTDIRPQPKMEARLIAQKGGTAVKRVKKQLTITAGGRSIVMTDQPSDDDMDGTYYYFCDRKEGYILVTVFDGADFSGSLINEATGKVQPGGVPVVFTEDRKSYLATTHSSGSDSENWTLYGEKGIIWQGANGFHSKNGEEILANFTRPAFDAQGKLSARAECYSDPGQNWPVMLEQKGKKWAWTPFKKCSK